ncbi:MAG: AAA family ATPase [Phycisphaerales bacterium]
MTNATPTPPQPPTPGQPSGPGPRYAFLAEIARIINSGQSRSVLVHGNVHDLFHSRPNPAETGAYVPLVDLLCRRCAVPGMIVLVYELNGPIRIRAGADADKLKAAWISWQTGLDPDELILQSIADRSKQRERKALADEFDVNVRDAIGKPTVALEFLRQLTLCSRALAPNGRPFLPERLVVIIEAADMALPAGSGAVADLSPVDRQRIAIVQDWFSDPGFMRGDDTVLMIAESASLIHPRVSRLPSVLTIEVPAPDQAARGHFIEFFISGADGSPTAGVIAETGSSAKAPVLWAGPDQLAALTAGLSIHALRQLLVGAAHSGETVTAKHIVGKVEDFISVQLGDDVVEFSKPEHSLDDVVGFTTLKRFLREELIPRFRASGPDALPGAAVAGPIGGGKTYIFEAAAAALDLPVLTLKNIRSQWFGQTDVIFERLRRVLEALGKVIIVIDEADTQFGGVGADTHETERRLTGKIQQMMSDSRLRGRVIWLLMTARIHLLSPDIRRPGRVGDLIIPVLDPEGDDRNEFLRWMLKGLVATDAQDAAIARLSALTTGYSAAAYASLRSRLKAKASDRAGGVSPIPITLDEIEEIVRDQIQPAIGLARRYQTLQALVNCTRRSLLPNPGVDEKEREQWQAEIRRLESLGIR